MEKNNNSVTGKGTLEHRIVDPVKTTHLFNGCQIQPLIFC